jgi:hypothetical protein
LNIIFQINGGIGKSVACTGVVRAIKEQYPEDQLIVVTAYPEVFINNPYVDRCLGMGSFSYFYSDYVKDKDIRLMLQDPYLETEHITCSEHLLQTWSRMNGIEKYYNPEVYLTEREINFISQRFQSEKPIFLLQTNGGAQGQEMKYSWARDLPQDVIEKVVEEFSYEYNIIHVRREDQTQIAGTTAVHDSFRSICVLAMMSQKRLLIDSFVQHACAALNLPSTVCWVVNKPNVFGYAIHDNIECMPFTRPYDYRHSYINPFNIIGDPVEFPYNHEGEIFDVDAIIKSLKK